MKKCSKCKEKRGLEQFDKNKSEDDGYNNWCKLCYKEYRKQNREKIKLTKQKYQQNNKIRIQKYKQEYQINNKNKIAKYKKEYESRPKTISITKKRTTLRRQNDINFKLSGNLRTRLYQSIKKNYKSGSAVSDLGCSIDKLKLWLEMFWVEGMTWDNYGKGGWVIDHIRPLSSFDLTNREEFLKASNFTNLQPLWEKENLDKRAKLEWSQD